MIWSLFYFITIAIKGGPSKFNSTSIVNSILTVIVMLFWFQNIYYTSKVGACDFSKLKFDGHYKVGVRIFHTKTNDTEIMCFYPID